jgi:hypothetical protein
MQKFSQFFLIHKNRSLSFLELQKYATGKRKPIEKLAWGWLFTNFFFMLMCSGEEPTGCWTNLWCVPAKRRVVGKERERANNCE